MNDKTFGMFLDRFLRNSGVPPTIRRLIVITPWGNAKPSIDNWDFLAACANTTIGQQQQQAYNRWYAFVTSPEFENDAFAVNSGAVFMDSERIKRHLMSEPEWYGNQLFHDLLRVRSEYDALRRCAGVNGRTNVRNAARRMACVQPENTDDLARHGINPVPGTYLVRYVDEVALRSCQSILYGNDPQSPDREEWDELCEPVVRLYGDWRQNEEGYWEPDEGGLNEFAAESIGNDPTCIRVVWSKTWAFSEWADGITGGYANSTPGDGTYTENNLDTYTITYTLPDWILNTPF
jgi:hypothetical protein